MSSESPDTILLKQRLAELEEELRRANLRADFLAKMIEIAGDKLGIDIKKKYGAQLPKQGGQPTREQE